MRSSGSPVTSRQMRAGLVVRAHAQVGVAREHGDHQPVRVDAVDPGQQLPGPRDGVLLEVVAEGEVAQHLEERVMPRRSCPPRRGRCACRRRARTSGPWWRARMARVSMAGEDVLELDHARVGEQQGGIVLRDQRGRMHPLVPTLGKEVEERGSDLCGFHGREAIPDRGARQRARSSSRPLNPGSGGCARGRCRCPRRATAGGLPCLRPRSLPHRSRAGPGPAR